MGVISTVSGAVITPDAVAGAKLADPTNNVIIQTITRNGATLLATVTLGSSSSPSDSPANVVSASNTNGLTQDEIGGIIGGVVGAIMIVLIAWACCWKARGSGGSTSYGSSSRSSRSSGSSSSRSTRSISSSDSAEMDPRVGGRPSGGPPPMAQRVFPPGPGPAGAGFPAGRGGPFAMGRGGPIPMGRGGPAPMMGRGGPPPMMGRGGMPPMMGRGGPPPMMGRGGPP
ncbi:hypothetical protein BX600DRAFT_509490 [Xylariales sp. PMI_506]|nr:hypothetical protein BX600DRAFT_509490 [Xylariales sp. PMI_506]